MASMWIKQNPKPEWSFPGTESAEEGTATYDYVTGSQVLEAVNQISNTKDRSDGLPF